MGSFISIAIMGEVIIVGMIELRVALCHCGLELTGGSPLFARLIGGCNCWFD